MTNKIEEIISIDEKAKTVTITLPLAPPGHSSKSGKTTRVCSTSGGMRTNVMYQGKPVTVNVNAYIAAD